MRFYGFPAFFLGMLVLAFHACNGQGVVEADGEDGNSHARMVYILDSMASHALYLDNFLMNERYIAHWKEKIPLADERPDKQMQYRYRMANEMLNAGHTQDAIQEFTDLAKLQPEKTVYDILAVSYLDLAKKMNQTGQSGSASSIIPIRPEGWDRVPLGAESAAQLYIKILKVFPDDLQARYLLNIAFMKIGQYPLGVPEEYLIPPAAFSSANPSFPRFEERASDLGLTISGHAGGVCFEDFNNDGFLDIFTTSNGLSDQVRYFVAKGDGTYQEMTEKANLMGILGGMSAIHADYNNDGWTDIFILRGAWLDRGGRLPNSLLRNNGDGTFSDVTIDAGLLTWFPTQAACWGDVNNDGWIDLFVGNESKGEGEKRQAYPCELYMNNGDGTFSNTAASTAMNFEALVKGCAWGDINNDGLPDLYVSVLNGPNKLFLNLGGTTFYDWRFEEIGGKAGVEEPLMSFSTWFFDYNNDGFQDIFVSGYDAKRLIETGRDAALEYLQLPLEAEVPRLYRNNGNNTFSDVTASAGLNKAMYGMGGNFGDLDNDGWLDLYIGTGTPDFQSLIPNRMFRNAGGERFEDLTMNGFGSIERGSGVAFGDRDNDGDQDIFCVSGGFYQGDTAYSMLFENPGFSNSWITLKLEGTTSNRSAIGAKIKVSVQGRDIYRVVGTGGSGGSASLQEEIGLGKASGKAKVEITWPGGNRQQFDAVPLNKVIMIKEGNNAINVKNK